MADVDTLMNLVDDDEVLLDVLSRRLNQQGFDTVTADSGCGTDVTFELEMRWNDGSTSTSTFTVPSGSFRSCSIARSERSTRS